MPDIPIYPFFPPMKVKALRFPSRLWFRYCWLKYILKKPVIGFLGSIPIFGSEDLDA